MNLHNKTDKTLSYEKAGVEIEVSSCVYVATSVFNEHIKPIIEQDDDLAIRPMVHYTAIINSKDMPKTGSDIQLDENVKVYPKEFLTKKGILNKNPLIGKKVALLREENPTITFIDEVQFRELDKQADLEAYRFKYDEN